MPKVLIAPATLTKVEGEYRKVLRDAGFELVINDTGHQLVEDGILAALTGVAPRSRGPSRTRRVCWTPIRN